MQKRGAVSGLWESTRWSRFMALIGHQTSVLAAIINVIPLRKGSVLDAGTVSSMYVPSSEIRILCLVRNYLLKETLSSQSASRYVYSPNRKNPAKASVNAA